MPDALADKVMANVHEKFASISRKTGVSTSDH
jgi:hypothetical protein